MAEKTNEQLSEEVKILKQTNAENITKIKNLEDNLKAKISVIDEKTKLIEVLDSKHEKEVAENTAPVVDEEREFFKEATISIFSKNPHQGGEEACAFAEEVTKAVFKNLNSK